MKDINKILAKKHFK